LERALASDNGKFAQWVAAFLLQNAEVAWLFVGVDQPELLAALTPPWQGLLAAKRIRYLPFRSDLRAVYEHCDIYVHPFSVVGGGMGIAMAIAEGIPALVGHNSDAASFIPNALLYQNQDDLLARLGYLVAAPQQRHKVAARQRGHIETHHSLAAVSEYLYPILCLARERHGCP
jgi:glycosyltransferase involved in cell wall biosynthesis